MRWIRQYTLYNYIKQGYHRWSIGVVGLVFVFSYTLAWLSPSDTDKIFSELSTSILEILFILWAIVLAVHTAHKRIDTTTHTMHAQWLSYPQIFIAHRSVGATIILLVCLLMCVGLFLATMFGVSIGSIILLSLYLYMKILLIYTIVFVLSHYSNVIVAGVLWLSLYILFYSFWLIQLRSQWLGQFAQYIVDIMIYVSPYFISIGQNTIQREWLSDNIFTIVMSYGIYILCLLILGIRSYVRTRWK